LFDDFEASNVSFLINYEGGNGGPYSSQSISSTGVVGLSATLQAGSLTTGNGSLTFTVSGKPTSQGNASFSLNILGHECSIILLVKPKVNSIYESDITDSEGNTYKTFSIGTQQWMAENLKVTKYNDGSDIANITSSSEWRSATIGGWVYYDNNSANNAKYGKLYNWFTINPTTNGNKNICPIGWHVPTDAEWTILTNYLGDLNTGGKMKEEGLTSWYSPNTDATNTSLFTGLPGGYRNTNGTYSRIGEWGSWWSSTAVQATTSPFLYSNAMSIKLTNISNSISSSNLSHREGLSVRCLKD
jgi:uncharacterized protein (TIGR02145 family)